jgi:hypothetical protein
MEREPDHPAGDLAASEALLDRAEVELEALFAAEPQATAAGGGEQATLEPTLVAPPPAPRPAASSTGPLPAAQRVTHERPALERITMERAALQPHPRWRRLMGRVGQPAVLSTVATVAVVLGLVAIFGSGELLRSGGKESPGPRPGAVVPGDVEVAVLNGTSVPKLGAVANSAKQFDQTVVMYESGQKRAAKKVANDLGVNPVQPITRQVERAADGAAVVVIAGADRAQP